MSTNEKQHVSIVICGHVDSGKCLGVNTPIIMFDGSIKMVQNIQVGDKLMGSDSTARIVLSTTSGQDQMYDVVPTRGDTYTVNSKHVLTLKATNQEQILWDSNNKLYTITWLQDFDIKEKVFSVSDYRSQHNAFIQAQSYLNNVVPGIPGYVKCGNVFDISLSDFNKLAKNVKRSYEGFSVGVKFQKRDVPIEPYVLGYWLCTNNSHPVGLYKGTSTFRRALRQYGFSHDMHVPDDYKLNSREIRLKLIAGMIDGDGHCGHGTYSLNFTNEKLYNDTLFIARSLGFGTYTSKDQCYYKLTIFGKHLETIPVLLDRTNFKTKKNNIDPNMVGIKIKSVGKQDYYGFELDGDGRFLLGDFTVTHNSTTTGRLLYELKGIGEREMQKLQEKANQLGKSSFAFAYYMDRQEEERKRGITIACTTKEFYTDKYHFTVIDAPGHRDYIKNMITGSSQADVAVLMVPADGNFITSVKKGNHKEGEVQGQTRQHARLINLSGVKQLIVCINKMDCKTAGYSQERYKEIKKEIQRVLIEVGWSKKFVQTSVPVLPISGWVGDNLITKSDKMKWWEGTDVVAKIDGKKQTLHIHTLHDALDKMVQLPKRKLDAPLRMPVSGVYKIKGVGDVITGRVEQGKLEPGQEVKFIPTHTESNSCEGKVFSVEMHHKSVPFAGPGDNVGINVKGLDKTNMPKVGDIVILKSDTDLKIAKQITTLVQVLDHPGELKPGYTPVAFIRTNRSPVKMAKINWKMGKSTGKQKVKNPKFVKANEMAEIVLEPQTPFVADTFKNCEGLGRVAIMEGNGVVMLGKVMKVT